MKKMLKIAPVLCMMTVLVLCLTACGGNDPVGTWNCVNVTDMLVQGLVDNGYPEEEARALISMFVGEVSITLQLNKDKTCILTENMGTETTEMHGTWSADDKGVTTVENETDEAVTYLWQDDSLTVSQDGMTLIFKKK